MESRLVLRPRSNSAPRAAVRRSWRSSSRSVSRAAALRGWRSSRSRSRRAVLQPRKGSSPCRAEGRSDTWKDEGDHGSRKAPEWKEPGKWLKAPLTRLPPGRQVHLPGVVSSDDGLLRWLDEEANQHMDWIGSGPLECIDVSRNNLTDRSVNALLDYLMTRERPTKRLKLFGNTIREPLALCDFIRDNCCGIAAQDGLGELHLSHNQLTDSMLDRMLDSIGQAVASVGGWLRPPFYVRVEMNPTLDGVDTSRFEDNRSRGYKICLNAGYGKSGCSTRHCKHGADVHLIFTVVKGSTGK